MTKVEARRIRLGIYWIHWKHGGRSVGSIGMLNDGTRWFAVSSWTGESVEGIASTNWSLVERVERIYYKGAV